MKNANGIMVVTQISHTLADNADALPQLFTIGLRRLTP